MLKDIGGFNISVDYSHFEQILGGLYDLADDKDGLLFTQLAIIGHIFKQISMWTIFRDEIAVRGCFVDIFELDYVGVAQFLQNLYLVIEHLKTGR